ncbi:hypothetical protein L0Z72_05805 [candidate division KSB1 bacterium]|nr:hypothetical protein [candidate division KSB1 bacterium]
MKIISNILIVIFLVLIDYTFAVGEGEHQYLEPSPLAKAKFELAKNIQQHDSLARPEVNLVITENPSKTHKDRRKAFFRSLLIPGAGEYYLGKHNLAKAFFFTEISLWVSYIAFREYGKWQRDDALAFAATHSGANIAGKPSQFFIDIGNYQDIYQYNDAKQRMFQFEKVYADEDYFWSWDLDTNRRKFDKIRLSGDQALNRSVFVLGGIFANHLFSAIHSVWQTHRYNKKLEAATGAEIGLNIRNDFANPGFSIIFSKRF